MNNNEHVSEYISLSRENPVASIMMGLWPSRRMSCYCFNSIPPDTKDVAHLLGLMVQHYFDRLIIDLC